MLGIERLINGDFATDLSGFSIDGGTVVWDDGAASFTGSGGRLSQAIADTNQKKFQIEFDILAITGTGFFYQGDSLLLSPTQTGHYTLIRTFSTDSYIAFGVNGTAQYSNLSVKEAIAPAITAISSVGGVVTLTVGAEGTVDIYSRTAGTSLWTLSLQNQAAGDLEIEGLTAGAAYEFYAVEYYDSQYLAPSNIAVIYVYNDNLAGAVNIEKWILGRLTALGLFKTVDHWRGQIADGGGPAAYTKYAPFAFVTFSHIAPRREGDYDLNRRIGFLVYVGAQDDDAGVSRIGSASKPGSSFLMEAVTAALDDKHPGAEFTCDRFYLTDSQIIINAEKMSEIYLGFEADWIIPSTNS